MPHAPKPAWKQVRLDSIVVPPNSLQAILPEAAIRIAIRIFSPHLSTLEILHPIVVCDEDLSLCAGHRTYRIIHALADRPDRMTWVVSCAFPNPETVSAFDELVAPLLGSPTDSETVMRFARAKEDPKWLRYLWVDPTDKGIAEFLKVSPRTVQRAREKLSTNDGG